MTNTLYAGRKVLQAAFVSLFFTLIPSVSQAVDTPSNVRGSVIADGTVKWEWNWVPGAERYDIIVNSQYVATSGDPSYTSRNLSQGQHSVSIKAIDGSWNYSSASSIINVTVGSSSSAQNTAQNTAQSTGGNSGGGSTASGFAAPNDQRGSQVGLGSVRWEWAQVQGASQYELTVDGQVVATMGNLEFTSNNLWAGEHSMTVRAIDGNNNYSGRSATAKIDVPSWFDPNNPARSYSVGEAEPTATNSGNNNPIVNAPAPPPPAPVSDTGLIDPQSWTKSGLPSGWELTFSDEFDGNSLNGNRWHSQLRWDGEWNGERYEYRIINGEAQMYVNILSPDQEHLDYLVPQYNPFEFDGSRLAIRATRNPLRQGDLGIDHGPIRDVARQQKFLSGAISSFDKFHQKYGRFEARIKIPSHLGTFPAFWLYHQNRRWEGTQRTEIDIMENLGHAPHFIYNSFHYHTDVTASYSGNANFIKPFPSGQVFTGTDYSQNYHTYAVEWSPGYVAWFIDDNKVSEMWNDNANHEELYLILNLAMGGNWTNYPVSSGGLGRPGNERYPTQNDVNNFNNPALEIDFVRVYRPR